MQECILISLKAHKTFCVDNIQRPANKTSYEQMFDKIIKIYSFYDYYTANDMLNLLFDEIKTTYEDNKTFNIKYKLLALEHCKDVVQTLSNRFGGELRKG
jgi:hypothetical protein